MLLIKLSSAGLFFIALGLIYLVYGCAMGFWLVPSCKGTDNATHKKVLVYAMIGAMVATGVMAVWATIGAASVAAGLLSMFTGIMQN